MSTMDSVLHGASGAISALGRRMLANALAWLQALARAPRAAYVYSLSRTEYRAGLVVAAIAVVMLMAFADGPAATWARTLPGWLLGPVGEFSDFGKGGWFALPLGIALILIAALDRPDLPHAARLVLASITARVGFLFVAIGAPGLFVSIIKRLIGRARPMVEGNDPILFYPLSWNVKYAALPSGHATTAFAAAFAIGAIWPAGRPLLWLYAIGIALSRVLLTSHHPSDVLAGAVVAWIGVTLVRDVFASQRLGFTLTADGVRPRPGPSWRRIKAVARAVVGL